MGYYSEFEVDDRISTVETIKTNNIKQYLASDGECFEHCEDAELHEYEIQMPFLADYKIVRVKEFKNWFYIESYENLMIFADYLTLKYNSSSVIDFQDEDDFMPDWYSYKVENKEMYDTDWDEIELMSATCLKNKFNYAINSLDSLIKTVL